MYYETSSGTMIAEQAVWDGVVPRACELLCILEKRASGLWLSKYINVLFGLRSARVDYKCLTTLQQQVYSTDQQFQKDKFILHKKLKDYLGNIDSTLDYLENFYSACKDENGKKLFWFKRKKYDFDRLIGDIRNEVMHEGVPSVRFRPGRFEYVCYTDVAGPTEGQSTIEVRFDLDGKGKWHVLATLLTHTYGDTRNLIKKITGMLCTNLGPKS